VRYVHKWAWNPVGGYQDAYSAIIHSGIVDPFMANNPYNGDKIPLLAKSWSVQTGNILVPTSAITYDYKLHKWVHVKPGTVAKSMVILKLNKNLGVFHDGQPVRIVDMLYWVYLVREWGTKSGANDTRYDSYIASVDSTWIHAFKGVQYVPPDTLIIYTDLKHFDPNELADMASSVLAPSVPWELLYAEEQAVMSGKVAFSPNEASAKGVDWLDALNPKHVKLVMSYLEKDMEEGVVPPQVAELAKLLNIDVKPNYEAVIKFIKEHGHMVIGNGPLYLDKYDPTTDSAILKAFRNPKYPFSASQFAYLSIENVKFAQVKSVNVPPVVAKGTPLSVTVEVVTKGTNEPLKNAIVFVAVYGPNNELIAGGFAKMTKPGTYVFQVPVDVMAKAEPGTYSVSVIAYSKEAYWPSMAKATFLVLG
jgi:peptide/nickel transport system substrate-binding protein